MEATKIEEIRELVISLQRQRLGIGLGSGDCRPLLEHCASLLMHIESLQDEEAARNAASSPAAENAEDAIEWARSVDGLLVAAAMEAKTTEELLAVAGARGKLERAHERGEVIATLAACYSCLDAEKWPMLRDEVVRIVQRQSGLHPLRLFPPSDLKWATTIVNLGDIDAASEAAE